MNRVYADTFFWVALANSHDEWHDRARELKTSPVFIVTTDEALAEFLTFLSGCGPELRSRGIRLVEGILGDQSVEVRPQTHDSFLSALELYKSRPDKRYSLVDCAGMQTMRELGIRDALTHDRHFEQEGFGLLMQ